VADPEEIQRHVEPIFLGHPHPQPVEDRQVG
jgi:hypothetical protein